MKNMILLSIVACNLWCADDRRETYEEFVKRICGSAWDHAPAAPERKDFDNDSMLQSALVTSKLQHMSIKQDKIADIMQSSERERYKLEHSQISN